MAPPGMNKKKDLAIAVGAPKGGGMKPPGMEGDAPEDKEPDADDAGGKVSREKALVLDENHRCDNCVNYDATSGECKKVEGYFDPGAACLRYFEPGESDEAEPDADDMGGPSDDDADDK